MLRTISIILVLTIISCFSEDLDVNKLRNKFYSSVDNSQKSRSFLDELKILSSANTDPIIIGYLAATSMVMAKHVYNPYSKFKYFIDGKNILEKTIRQTPSHVELRLIRFAIQTNVPSFLGYYKEIQIDKQFLLKSISKSSENPIDSELESIIKKYLVQSKVCTTKEIEESSH